MRNRMLRQIDAVLGRAVPKKSKLQRDPKPRKLPLRMETRTRRPVGRPSKLTLELADQMFEAIANGASVKHMLADNDISANAFYRWLAKNPEFNKRYEEATFIRHRMFGEALIGLSTEVG